MVLHSEVTTKLSMCFTLVLKALHRTSWNWVCSLFKFQCPKSVFCAVAVNHRSVLCFSFSSLHLPLKMLTIPLGLNWTVIFHNYLKVHSVRRREDRNREAFDSVVSGGRSHNKCQELYPPHDESRRGAGWKECSCNTRFCDEGFLPRLKQRL
jgi:hypothetical protein